MMSVHVNVLPLRARLPFQRLRRASLTHEAMAGGDYLTSTKDSLHLALNRGSRITRSSGFRAYSEFPRCQREVNSSRHRL